MLLILVLIIRHFKLIYTWFYNKFKWNQLNQDQKRIMHIVLKKIDLQRKNNDVNEDLKYNERYNAIETNHKEDSEQWLSEIKFISIWR